MIVEPAPIGPRSRGRRALRVAALGTPVVLFVLIAGAGLLGPRPSTLPSSSPAGTAEAARQAAPDASDAGRSPSPPAAAGLRADPPDGVPFPRTVAGLEVRGVRWVVEARPRGVADGLIAVAGYLGIDAIPEACADPRLGMFGPFCARTAILTDQPWFGGTFPRPDSRGPHLHPQLPAGVRMPSQAALTATSASTPTPPVVLVGRFGDPRATPCVPGGRHCGQEFVVERVAWVDGREYPNTLTVDPAAGAEPRTNAELRAEARLAIATLGPDAVPLLTALVAPPTIARIDPALAAATEALDARSPVWFIRALDAAGARDRIRWAVVDPASGRQLAEGELPTTGSR